jgi:hypothetical protein
MKEKGAMRMRVLMGLLAMLPGLAAADYCAERAGAALAEIQPLLRESADGASASTAREVLERLCRDAQAAGEEAGSAPASTEVLGVEVKQAPEGSAGHQRSRKMP